MALGLTGTTTGLGVTTPSFRKKMLDELNPDQKPEDPFDITKTELYRQTQQTAQDQMAGKTADFDIQANIARDAQKAAQAEAARVKRQQLMNLGLRDTGTYVQEGVINPAEQNARETADLERRLAAERAGQVRAQQTAGQTAAMSLLGMQAGQQNQRQQQSWSTGERVGTQQWQSGEGAAQRGSQEKIAFAGLDQQAREMAQQAMQFDSELGFKRYAMQAGFDEAATQRAWQSAETQKGIDSGERVAYAQLQQKEREMLQELSVATNRLDFEKLALDKNLNAQEQQRVWEAVQEDKRIKAQKDLAVMGQDLERWKQGRAEEMMRAGWTHEDAMQTAELKARQLDSDRTYYLQKQIANQNFSQREKELAQQATQFADKLSFDRWATNQGFTEQEKQRVWQATQNAADRTLRVDEARDDRVLQREIEAGRISQADRQLLQQASQFKDQQSLQRWMTTQEGIRATQDRNAQYRIHSENLKAQAEELKTQIAQRKWEVTQQGISAQQDRNLQVLLQKEQQVFAAQQQTERILAESTEATAQRLWQADQNVSAQKAHAALSIAMAEMEQKGVNTRMLMSVLEALPEEQASLVISQVAKEAGLTWTDDAGVRHDGLPISQIKRTEAGSFDEPAFTFNSADSPFREIRAGQVINGASGTNSPGNPTTPLADGQYIRLDENFRVYPTMDTSAGQQTVPAGSYQVKTIDGIMYLVSQDGKKYQMSAAPAEPASGVSTSSGAAAPAASSGGTTVTLSGRG